MKTICYALLLFTSLACPLFGAEPVKIVPETPTEYSVEDWKKEAQVQDKVVVSESHFGELFVRMILMLLITLVLLFVLLWLYKRFVQGAIIAGGSSNRIQIIERRALSPKAGLYLIRIDNQEILIAESTEGLQLLKDIPNVNTTPK
ncbi:MAG: hypothetical protein JWO53_1298 [Chlamydiia bacterium]|nr:hypothetical protein [Chlamydiia bacterium]